MPDFFLDKLLFIFTRSETLKDPERYKADYAKVSFLFNSLDLGRGLLIASSVFYISNL